MKKYIFLFLVFSLLIFSPVAIFADGPDDLMNNPLANQQKSPIQNPATPTATTLRCQLPAKVMLGDLFSYATCIISVSVIPLIFALALAVFVWGVVQYVIYPQDEGKKEKGRQFMLWGIIALAVMVSVWGLVAILRNTFDINDTIPQLQTH